jgi:hypothetical protein
VLGLLAYSEDEEIWECTVLIGDSSAQLQIGGDDKPSPTLIAHAQEIVRDGAGFMRMVDDFLEAQAHADPGTAEDVRRLSLESICLLSPERPNDGMLYFHGPDDDEHRLWRCDYLDRKLDGLRK